MPKGLSYLDAVKILGGSGPLTKAVDNLLGGALSAATLGGSDAALSFFDAKAEMVRLGSLVTLKITDIVRGLGRYNRTERLLAASGVLAVTALFESLDDCFRAAGLESAEFTRDDQIILAGGRASGELLRDLLDSPIPLPSPARSHEMLLSDLRVWFRSCSTSLGFYVSGLAVWDRAHETAHSIFTDLILDSLPGDAVERYDELHRRLAGEIPEFAIWSGRLEVRATGQSLRRLEDLLVRASAGRDPSRHRAALARAYRAKLSRPVLGGDAGGVVLPDLVDAYVDPLFQMRVAESNDRPADETWWNTEVRDDLYSFLATYLTTAGATETPLLLLGQPGAGKSSLTHILAARLPATDYLVARVPLREVPAEAEIQDQIELAIRSAIGETVAWAEMAEDALAVVLLDGFDELLQATGLHQSDYLQRVAQFQARELAQNRPVAVIVTSRVAVADRARIPAGSPVVRLEPFSDSQIEQWLRVWNQVNPSIEPLRSGVLARLPELAGQPLLLLMLALYHAGGNPLTDDFDTAHLYERLLGEFADREVRRVHAGRPESAMPALVEAELLRLSVVAFAMFHRNRLWITERELDDDLAGLGLTPSRTADHEGFRAPLTAAQEMVGRFFFIQRAQARQDDKDLQTYEFLHATFGEYLVARLVVQALQDTTARENAATLALRFGPPQEADLLQDLLGYTALTARNTVLQFVRSLLDIPARAEIRDFLVRRARQAVTRPQYPAGRYRPIDKRIDYWMATYSFNLVLLTLACGGELRATDLFTEAKDPAEWLRGTALQWRAAMPGGIYLEALEEISVRRDVHDGRRDLVLHSTADPDLHPLDPAWSNRSRPAERGGAQGYPANFSWGPALTSMHLSNSLSDDTLLHALEPLIFRLPDASRYYVVHDSGETESVAHSLVAVWMASGLGDDGDTLAVVYRRAARAVAGSVHGTEARAVAAILLRSVRNDATRLRPEDVVAIVAQLAASPAATAPLLVDAMRCLLLPQLKKVGETRRQALVDVLAALVSTATHSGLIRDVVDMLADSGNLEIVLTGVRDNLNPDDREILAGEVYASYPDLAAILRYQA
ncbi:hypothetical protein BJ973_003610 [Actinoplanes tereljensis]|uniref:AAA+ ATPase domain-containing protein n=1 Tax=Paractinoplanes tereljensis TaxID=571912 RepID=A0A919NWP2_9ACTN|nr:hypothetical protein [Actinoplanes tereljensis]GIF25331.1 hypothetical protein Ate02nite_80610 [Actinoplanes tereljensis]